jgi:hypothetical protein
VEEEEEEEEEEEKEEEEEEEDVQMFICFFHAQNTVGLLHKIWYSSLLLRPCSKQ